MKFLDLLLSVLLLPIIFSWILIKFFISKFNKKKVFVEKSLLVIQNYHTYGSIKKSGHDEMITQTDLDGYFNKVYTLYPTVGSDKDQPTDEFDGRKREVKLSAVHTFLEYKMYTFKNTRFPTVSFILSQFLMLNEMIGFVKKNNICVVRGYCPFLTGLYSLIIAKCSSIPFTLRVGGNYDLMHKNGLMVYKKIFRSYTIAKKVAKFVFRNCSSVSAVNINNMNYCIENGANPDICIVVRVGNMVDSLHYREPNERDSVQEFNNVNRPIAISVGRLTKVKHPEDVLMATKIAKQEFPNLLTLIIGDGDMEDELKALSTDLGLEDNILFLGKKNQEYLSNLYPQSDVYLSPLTGRSMVEAALAGLPLIAYDYEWHKEIVKDDSTGFLVPYRDAKQMGLSIVKVLKDKVNANRMGGNSRLEALEMMDKEKIKQSEITMYNSILTWSN